MSKDLNQQDAEMFDRGKRNPLAIVSRGNSIGAHMNTLEQCGRPAVGDPIGDRVPITPTYVDRSSGKPGSPEPEIVGDDSPEVEETLP